jgi:circadian clock protein KaiB
MSRRVVHRFRLYVADDAPNSARALSNLTALCREHLPGRHEIDVVDVFRHPERALADEIYMTPTLLRLSPSPARKILGSLSDTLAVLQLLGLEERGT